MAMDNTPPRNRLIALYTALAVATLLGLFPAFNAYYDRIHTHVQHDTLEVGHDLSELEQARGREAVRRAEIDRAVSQLARQGRMAFPQVQPRQPAEMNLDPLRGWAQLPQELPVRPRPPRPPEPPLVPFDVPDPLPGEGAPETGEGTEAP